MCLAPTPISAGAPTYGSNLSPRRGLAVAAAGAALLRDTQTDAALDEWLSRLHSDDGLHERSATPAALFGLIFPLGGVAGRSTGAAGCSFQRCQKAVDAGFSRCIRQTWRTQ